MQFRWPLLAVFALVPGCGSAKMMAWDRPLPAPSASTPTSEANSTANSTGVASGQPSAVEQPSLHPCVGQSGLTRSAQAVPFLKGQVHIHTQRSFDAAAPVDEVLTFYAEHGYDFLAITDHNHITIPEPHASGLLLVPGVELTYNATTCEPPPRPGYLCAFHTNVLFLNPMRDTARGRHFILPFRRRRLGVFDLLIRRSKNLQGIMVVNHPTYHYAVSATLMAQLMGRGIRLVEFFNGGVLDRSKDGPLAEIEKGEQLWDTMLDRGHRVFAVGGDDAHHFSDAATIRMTGKTPLESNRVWIMVRASKDLIAIREAMSKGDFYVSTGVSLLDLQVSKQHVHVTMKQKPGESYVTRFMGDGGHILARVEGADACYQLTGSEGYVRAVVESDKGTYAWTQPVMLLDTAKEAARNPTQDPTQDPTEAKPQSEPEGPPAPGMPPEGELPTVW